MAPTHRLMLGTFLLAGIGMYVVPVLAAGDRDPAFGNDGERLIERSHSSHIITERLGDIAMRPDGRFYWAMADGGSGIWLARMRADGAWDDGFGDGGLVELGHCIPTPRQRIRLAVDDQGSAVLWTGSCLLRFDADGQIDPGFATGTMPPQGFVAAHLLRDGAGRWLLAGTLDQQFNVRRYLADGGDDAEFGENGSATTTFPASELPELRAMAERPDGHLLLAGWQFFGPHTRLTMVQLHSNGHLDDAFGDQGVVIVAPPPGFSAIDAEALLLDRDGSAIVAGNGNSGSQGCCALVARFDATGTLDPQFGLRLMMPPGNAILSPFGEHTSTLALLPGGRILLARISFPLGPPFDTRTRFTLVRLHADGEIDGGFGDAGWRTYVVSDPTGTGMSAPYSQPHGMIYSGASALMFGRTFFEHNSQGKDFVTLVRVRFERLFADGFEP